MRRADVVHVFSASYWSFLLAPLPAVIVARLLGRPVLVNYRSGEAPDHLRRSTIARTTLRAVDRNIVPSRFLQQVFAEHEIPAQIIPNIIDREQFRFRLRDPLRPRLLSTRNFEPLYDVASTLRAFALVQRRYPDATLTLVGAGSEDASLRRLAAELGLRGVTFAGRVAPEDISTYYADADIYVQTPTIDNMPSSILEAFASGLPVVSTEAGGVPAMLTDGVHGLLAPIGDADQMAAQVLRLLEDSTLARRLALAARDSTDALSVGARARSLGRGLSRAVHPIRCSSHGPDRYEPDAPAGRRLADDGPPRAVVSGLDGGPPAGGTRRLRGAPAAMAPGRAGDAHSQPTTRRSGPPSLASSGGLDGRAPGAHAPLRDAPTAVRPRIRRHGRERARTILAHHPGARADAVRRGDRVAPGSSISSATGPDVWHAEGERERIDWHLDPVHRRRAPQAYWSRVPYLEPSCGDHKVVWELNRHQSWLSLGRAYWLTDDERYRDGVHRATSTAGCSPIRR